MSPIRNAIRPVSNGVPQNRLADFNSACYNRNNDHRAEEIIVLEPEMDNMRSISETPVMDMVASVRFLVDSEATRRMWSSHGLHGKIS